MRRKSQPTPALLFTLGAVCLAVFFTGTVLFWDQLVEYRATERETVVVRLEPGPGIPAPEFRRVDSLPVISFDSAEAAR